MTEGLAPPVSPVERAFVGNLEVLKGLDRKESLYLANTLGNKLKTVVDKINQPPGEIERERNFITEASGKNSVDPDRLWDATQALVPKREAKIAYEIIRRAQVIAVGGRIPEKGWAADRMHTAILRDPNLRLDLVDKMQLLFGKYAALRLLEQELEKLKFDRKTGNLSRRKFLKVAAMGTAATVGAKILRDTLPQERIDTKTPTVTRTPINLPNPENTPSPEKLNLFIEIIKPFVEEARRKRAQKEKEDPEYYHRVDKELNENRINLVIFGYSEEHGDTYEQYSGAPTILSYDMNTGEIGVIHLSRDIRVPELERRFPDDLMETQRVRSIYKKGGFDLMGNICERITGLSSDFQIVMKDVVLKNAIDQLVDGKLSLTIPKDHDTASFRLDGIEYGEEYIPKGTRDINTSDLMRYILAEDKNPGGKEDERSYRKNEVLETLSQKIREKAKKDPLFMIKVLNFIKGEIDSKNIQTDFDTNLLSRSWQFLGGLAGAFGKSLAAGKVESHTPEINKNQMHVFHDPFFGDGGVIRVHNIKDNPDIQRDNPTVIKEAQQGKLPDWMLIPTKGNPYASDLVKDYWQSTRQIVKQTLFKR